MALFTEFFPRPYYYDFLKQIFSNRVGEEITTIYCVVYLIIIKNQHACLWLDQLNCLFGVIISFMNILLTSYQLGPTAFLISFFVWALFIENILTLTSYWKHFPILIFTSESYVHRIFHFYRCKSAGLLRYTFFCYF